ncbi:MAG: RelA/SpoT domain-containing protein [Methylocystis sp.]|nr:RelA/SpoT domain-containing protein [Methylocystis sp.]MCA3584541.1 RelA/SpoT domain-containing protein [Methylocystis sp.]MCA3588571.1 RelA/SpoT domain-containing protein [Methylocystis sp.]MCA3591360.1 RelA/SpoT domain-containing protein [Methylocystis sp.]
MISRTIPWGSKGVLNRIGEKLRSDQALSIEEIMAFNSWRGNHSHVMNGFQAMLRARTRGTEIVVAQRHKRRLTIIDKLNREPQMQLARMDDIAGIRLIFEDIKDLYDFRSNFLRSRHRHLRKSKNDKYDYIKRAKFTGYRGVHDIYSYFSQSLDSSVANGLMIEIQYRTKIQHAWATANEIVTMTTQHRTKFAVGDERYLEFFKIVSEIFARAFENTRGCLAEIDNSDLIKRFKEIDNEINLVRFLNNLPVVYRNIDFKNSAVLQFTKENLIVHKIPLFANAQDTYFKIEKEYPDDDIVLVLSETFDQIRSAYRNYFSDSKEFNQLLNRGLELVGQL